MNHFYKDIQGWFDFENVYRRAVEDNQDGALFIEIGSWKGKSTVFMAVEILNSKKKIRLDCIDAWSDKVDLAIKAYELDTEEAFERFKVNTSQFDFINYHRLTSVEASKLYEPESADFIYIDGSHGYDNVKQDIKVWYPIVKSGGVLAGHDAKHIDVKRALEDSTIRYGTTINTWVHHKE